MRDIAIDGHCRSRHWGLTLILMLAIAVSSCTTAPKRTSSKYYADDGPPETIPDNLDSIPDAVPRDEPFHRFANRPYTVFGRSYVPVVNRERTVERGIASWYGRKFQGQRTASGEPYDMFAMTAAHPTLPIPSYARVTNVKSGKSVVVRINDRGPFHSDRIIDLSYAAAARIGIAAAGSGLVEVERVFESRPGGPVIEPTVAAPAAPVVETPVVVQEAAGMSLQLGAFSSREGAEAFRDRLSRELSWNNEPLQIVSRDGLHRVRMGPYRNRVEAAAVADKVRESLGFAPTLVTH